MSLQTELIISIHIGTKQGRVYLGLNVAHRIGSACTAPNTVNIRDSVF